MSKRFNNAGKKLVIDEIEILGQQESAITMLQSSLGLAVEKKNISDLKNRLDAITSDGVITPSEKQALRREWANLESSYYKTRSQFTNDEDLSTSSYWRLLQSSFAQLDTIMEKVLADMQTNYTESDANQIDDLFYNCWTFINGCASVYENNLKFSDRYQLKIVGNLEFNDSTTLSIVAYNTVTGISTTFPASEFSCYRSSDGQLIQENTLSPTFTIANLNGNKSCEFFCEWIHIESDTAETDESGQTKTRLVTFFTLSIAKITQYQFSSSMDEEDLNKNDSAWSSNKPTEQPEGFDYLWRRESDDNGETWTYFRETGPQGPQGNQGPRGWSSATISLYKRSASAPSDYDGGVLIYTFSTASISGNMGTWSKTTPEGTDPLYVIYGSVLSQGDTDTIQPEEWTTPERISTEGTQGQPGLSVATVFIYQRSAVSPALPTTDSSYSFVNNVLSVESPWNTSVPSGDLPCWISIATAKSRTNSATIEADSWSAPVVLVKNGENGQDGQDGANGADGADGADGVGIASITTQYGLSDSQENEPTVWTDDRPIRSAGQIIWERLKITLTNDTTIYTEGVPSTGDKGDNGANGTDGADGKPAAETMIQYAWGKSPTLEPNNSMWLWDGFMIFDGNFISARDGLWSNIRIDKPTTGTWYLWIRFSTDGGKTWSKGSPVSGNDGKDAISISITPNETRYNGERSFTVSEQEIDFVITRTNITTGACVWTLPDSAYNEGVRFKDGGDSKSVTAEEVTLIIPALFGITEFIVTATLTDAGITLVAEARAYMSNYESGRKYLGVYPKESQDKPATANGLPLKTGDSITYIDTANNGTDIYVWIEDDGETQGHWTNDSNEINGTGLAYSIAQDTRYDIERLAAENPDTMQPIKQGAAWIFCRNFAAINAHIESIFAKKIQMQTGGKIYSSSYDENGNNESGDPGFWFDNDSGKLKATSAELEKLTATNASVEGTLLAPSFFTRSGYSDIDIVGNLESTIYSASKIDSYVLSTAINVIAFECEDSSNYYFAQDGKIYAISKSTGYISQVANLQTNNDIIYLLIHGGYYYAITTGRYIPGFLSSSWELFYGTSFSSLIKVTTLENYEGTSVPFPGQAELPFGITYNSKPGIAFVVSGFQYQGTPIEGIWYYVPDTSYVTGVRYWDSKNDSNVAVSRIYNCNFTNKSDSIVFLDSSSNKIYISSNIISLGTDGLRYPSPSTENITIQLSSYKLYCINNTLYFVEWANNNQFNLYRLQTFNASNMELLVTLSFDNYMQYNPTLSYTNGVWIFGCMYGVRSKFIVSRDLSKWYTFEINGNDILQLTAETGFGSAIAGVYLILANADSMYRISFNTGEINSSLHDSYADKMLYRSIATGKLFFNCNEYNITEIRSPNENIIEVKTSDGDWISIDKSLSLPVPTWIENLVLKENIPANLSKDMIPDSDNVYTIGTNSSRFDGYFNNLEANIIDGSKLPTEATAKSGQIYVGNDGVLRRKA